MPRPKSKDRCPKATERKRPPTQHRILSLSLADRQQQSFCLLVQPVCLVLPHPSSAFAVPAASTERLRVSSVANLCQLHLGNIGSKFHQINIKIQNLIQTSGCKFCWFWPNLAITFVILQHCRCLSVSRFVVAVVQAARTSNAAEHESIICRATLHFRTQS